MKETVTYRSDRVMSVPGTVPTPATVRAILDNPQFRFTQFTSVPPIHESIIKPIEHPVPIHSEPRIILGGKNGISKISATVKVPGKSAAALREYGRRLIFEERIPVSFTIEDETITFSAMTTTENRDKIVDTVLRAYTKFCEML